MYGKANKLDTVLTEQMMYKKEDPHPLESNCMTRMMTPEDWEKYGPLNQSESKNIQKSKVVF